MLLSNSGKGTNTINCVRSIKGCFTWFINDLNVFVGDELVDLKIISLIKDNDLYFREMGLVKNFCNINLLGKTGMDSIMGYRDFMKKVNQIKMK